MRQGGLILAAGRVRSKRKEEKKLEVKTPCPHCHIVIFEVSHLMRRHTRNVHDFKIGGREEVEVILISSVEINGIVAVCSMQVTG